MFFFCDPEFQSLHVLPSHLNHITFTTASNIWPKYLLFFFKNQKSFFPLIIYLPETSSNCLLSEILFHCTSQSEIRLMLLRSVCNRSIRVRVCRWLPVCHMVAVLLLSEFDIYKTQDKTCDSPTYSISDSNADTHPFHVTGYSYSKTVRANYRRYSNIF